ILLFDGETAFGWKIDGDFKIDQGVLALGGTRETRATVTTEFGYCSIRFDADADNAKDAKLVFNSYTGPFLNASPPGTRGWYDYYGQVSPGDISVWARGSKGFGVGGNVPQTTIGFHVPAGQKLLLRTIGLLPREPKVSAAAVSVQPPKPIF